jgi:hypothetical protein
MSTHDTFHTGSAPPLRQFSSLGTTLLILMGFLLLIFTHHNVIQAVGAVMLLFALITPALGKTLLFGNREPDEPMVFPSQEPLDSVLARVVPAGSGRRYLQFEDDLINALLRDDLSREAYVEQVKDRTEKYLRRSTRLPDEVITAIVERTAVRALGRYDAEARGDREQESRHRSERGQPRRITRSPRSL